MRWPAGLAAAGYAYLQRPVRHDPDNVLHLASALLLGVGVPQDKRVPATAWM